MTKRLKKRWKLLLLGEQAEEKTLQSRIELEIFDLGSRRLIHWAIGALGSPSSVVLVAISQNRGHTFACSCREMPGTDLPRASSLSYSVRLCPLLHGK